MFGENAIFGQTEITIDEKGRIFVPAYTKKEAGEELVLIYNDILNVHEIYSVSTLEEKYRQLEEKVMHSKTEKDARYYAKRLYQLSKSILKQSKVDSQGRMLIGKVFEGEEKLLTTGAYDHIIIETIKKK